MLMLLKTLEEYCKCINVSPPKHKHFDIRRFEDNMETVHQNVVSFRHKFYAIALKISGSGKAITGQHATLPSKHILFFNSPFQETFWDIEKDWKGYYLIFDEDFLASTLFASHFLEDFSFFKLEKAIPFQVAKQESQELEKLYNEIFDEYTGNENTFEIIEPLLFLLLRKVKKYFFNYVEESTIERALSKADLKLVTRFEVAISNAFKEEILGENASELHSPRYYAEKLNVHPNHLNATCKKVSGQTAHSHIQRYITQQAKNKLLHSALAIKEIAYSLHFESPNHFSSFFRKHTQHSPSSYRKAFKL